MIIVRHSETRGHSEISWLDSYHTFSFGDYYDPNHMSFRALRVINEDRVLPGEGFNTHSHKDMEIITYIIEGTLEHKDSIGTGSQIVPGDLQRMTAGTGVQHSEFNPSLTESVHLLQIWIKPHTQGLTPSYEQKHFDFKANKLVLLASPDGREGSLTAHQDVYIFGAKLVENQPIDYPMQTGRHAWIQVAQGQVVVNDVALSQGDGATISQEETLTIKAVGAAEILVFDLS